MLPRPIEVSTPFRTVTATTSAAEAFVSFWNVDYHISSGMFGATLVEPEYGVSEVDHEFYLGQMELDTKGNVGEGGHHF